MRLDRTALVDRAISRFGRERWNEHVKLLASAINAVGVAAMIGGFVAPLVNAVPPRFWAVIMLFFAGAVLHVAAQAILRYFRSKE